MLGAMLAIMVADQGIPLPVATGILIPTSSELTGTTGETRTSYFSNNVRT
jgi:hypothetical protein